MPCQLIHGNMILETKLNQFNTYKTKLSLLAFQQSKVQLLQRL